MYAADALGGKQHRMRDTIWNEKVQRMVFNIGMPKGLIQVLRKILQRNKVGRDESRNSLAH